ncbi:MAG: hypothetical protein HQL50_15005, partial [Magnetococcales bacterium]|nr:hypothetical protein [Magnetococcales bacterium]
NEERKRFVKMIFEHYPSRSAYYDLVVNSDYLHPRQIADLAMDAMERMGFETRSAPLKKAS